MSIPDPIDRPEPLRALESRRVFGAAIVLLVVLFLLVNAPWPMLGPDESAWLTSAVKVLNGAVLGRDAVLAKGPYLLFWHLAIYLVTGPNVIALHLIGTLWALATGAVVCLIALRLCNRTGLVATGLLYTAAMADPALRTNVYAEVLMALPLAVGFWALAIGLQRGQARWTLLAGMLVTLAVLTKQTAAFYALAMAVTAPLAVYTAGVGGGFRRVLVHWVAAAAGAGIAAAPWLGYVWAHQAGESFVDDFVGKSTSYVARLSGADVVANLQWAAIHVFPRYSLALIAAAAGLVWIMRRSGRTQVSSTAGAVWVVILPLWLIAAGVSVGSTGRFAAHYFSQLFPVAALLGGVWAGHTLPTAGAGSRGRLGLAALLLIAQCITMLPLIVMNAGRWHYAWVLSAQHSSWRVVGEYVRDHTHPDDTVFIWGDQTEVLYWAGREMASEQPWITLGMLGFTHAGPLFAERARGDVDWARFEEELEDWRPAYVVIAPGVQTIEPPEAGEFGIGELPELGEILGEYEYEHEASIRGYELYRREVGITAR